MVGCSIIGCKSETRKKVPGISFHQFPTNPERMVVWIRKIQRVGWVPHRMSVICSLHFENKYFKNTTKRQRLLDNAVPTIACKESSCGEVKKVRCSKTQCPVSSETSSSQDVNSLEITVTEVKIEPSENEVDDKIEIKYEAPVEDAQRELPFPIKEEPQIENPHLNSKSHLTPEHPASRSATANVDAVYPEVTSTIGGFITITPCENLSRPSVSNFAGSYSQKTSSTTSIAPLKTSLVHLSRGKTGNSDPEIDVFCQSMAAALKLLPKDVSLRLQDHFSSMISYEMKQLDK